MIRALSPAAPVPDLRAYAGSPAGPGVAQMLVVREARGEERQAQVQVIRLAPAVSLALARLRIIGKSKEE